MSRDRTRPEIDDVAAEAEQPFEQVSSNAADAEAAGAAPTAGVQQQKPRPTPQAPAALGGMGSTGPITVVSPKR